VTVCPGAQVVHSSHLWVAEFLKKPVRHREQVAKVEPVQVAQSGKQSSQTVSLVAEQDATRKEGQSGPQVEQAEQTVFAAAVHGWVRVVPPGQFVHALHD